MALARLRSVMPPSMKRCAFVGGRRVQLIHAPPSYPTAPRFLLLGDSMIKYIVDMPYTEVISIRGATMSTISSFLLSSDIDYEVVVLHVGTNCFESATFMSEYRELIEVVRQRNVSTDSQVWISSVLPRPCDFGLQITVDGVTMTADERLTSLNTQLSELADSNPDCMFLRTYRPFVNFADRSVYRALFAQSDGYHLRPAGWLALCQYISGALHNYHPTLPVPVRRSSYEYVLFTPYSQKVVAFFTFQSPLSNMFSCSFVLDGMTYCCSEQFITIQKALLFGDTGLASQLFGLSHPAAMKRLAKDVGNKTIWHSKARDLIIPGVFAKFSQNNWLKDFLLWTGRREIVEASPDRFWGVGHSLQSMDLWVPELRRGDNMMGRILMEVRSMLS